MSEYDAYPYDNFPFAVTHPDHLATLATLFGLRPAPPTCCRVLELGCGLGGNLIPMAVTLPGSAFVGVDRSSAQIAAGQADVAALRLGNIDLFPMDILDVDSSFGSFDYIVCHGVFSWVPLSVQAKILQICQAHLAPHGVAYISFNALPGWHLRGMIRDLLRREVGLSGAPEERVDRARAYLRFLDQTPAALGPAQAWLKSEIELLGQLSDAYLYHEHLSGPCHPMYFEDFARDADRAGLRYLAEAHLQSMIPDRLGPDIERSVSERARSVIEAEHLMDVLALKSFRRALLCPREALVDREITHRKLTDLWVSTHLEPASLSPDVRGDSAEAFARPESAELRTSLPILKAALVLLARDHPCGLPFEALFREASLLLGSAEIPEERARLGSNLLGIFAEGQIDLGVRERPYVTAATERPCATALARFQAARGRIGCTNLRHQTIAMDSIERALLQRLDGTRTREELVAALLDDARAGAISLAADDGDPPSARSLLRDIVNPALARLGRRALLMA